MPLEDFVGKAAYFVGDLDRKISEVMKRIVRPGDHVLDVGANVGVVTLSLAGLVGDRGVVHSFEPNPWIAGLLVQSIERNGLKNVRVHQCALGADDGTHRLAFSGQYDCTGTLDEAPSNGGLNHIDVDVRMLSSVAEGFGDARIRLMKIDVEGHELEVFRGAGRWLADSPPDAIVFESNTKREIDEPDPVVSLLAERGYAIYLLPKCLLSLSLVPYRPGDAKVAESHDMLAVRKECEQEIISRFTVLE